MSTLHRFFVPPEEVDGDHFPLPLSIRHQVERVLRLRDGDHVVLLTGNGYETVCRLEGHSCVVADRRLAGGEPGHRVTIVQALLKGDGLEQVVDRGTELGVAGFEFVVTERCIARQLSNRKLDRLRTIAADAAARAERAKVPTVRGPVPFETALAPGMFVLYERAGSAGLRQYGSIPTRLAIGPEGGFTNAEIERAIAAGAVIAGLGPRIMRARSAGMVAAALVLGASGDLG